RLEELMWKKGFKKSSWKRKLLSVGGRLVLINSILLGFLSSLPMYMMSFFEFLNEYAMDTRRNILD
ncbi:hypothetical protein BIFBRE_05066, partial [Bifidobacterium breve DSM 20213 = JCM 1192]